MLSLARIYFLVFGLFTIVGGIIGYVKAASTPSLVAGSISGLLLLGSALLLPAHRTVALIISLIVSLLLAIQFLPKFIRTGAFMPAGVMSLLSVLALAIGLAVWLRA